MRVLLDHCVNKHVKPLFTNHEVFHTSELGWEKLLNGELLSKASASFDVLVTVDKDMEFQTSLRGIDLAVAILRVRSNFPEELDRSIGYCFKSSNRYRRACLPGLVCSAYQEE